MTGTAGVPPAPSRARPRTGAPLPVALAVAAVLAQVAYPLTDGTARDRLTVATVLLVAATSVTHAAVHRGTRWAAGLLLVTAGGGFVAEAVGTATGYPFGAYSYADRLGPQLLDVPLVVPLAWTMLAYPCLLAGQRLCRAPWAAALVSGAMLTGWDLFLDPQMVQAGHWTWEHPDPGVPGLQDIPLTNVAGWLLVATLVAAALQALPRVPADDRVPDAFLLWTYLSSVLAHAAFFGTPGAAVTGGLGMGLTVVPWLLRSRSRR